MTLAVRLGLPLAALDTRLNTLLSQVAAAAVVGWAVAVALAGISAAQQKSTQELTLLSRLVLAVLARTQTLLPAQTAQPLACQG